MDLWQMVILGIAIVFFGAAMWHKGNIRGYADGRADGWNARKEAYR